MVAKIWKKVFLFVLIIACLFNVVTKLVKRSSLKEELSASAKYMQEQNAKNENVK